MGNRVRMKHRTRVKAGQQYRYDEVNPEQWKCLNCGRKLPDRWTLCRKLRNCPGRVRDRLLKAGKVKAC
jgi:hypothetical protein